MSTTNAERRAKQAAADDRSGELPFALPLELTVQDPEVIAEICGYPDGDARHQFALTALRIGVMALKHARGQVDADVVRRESERLLHELNTRLCDHARSVQDRLTTSLKEYFDPQDGRFHERVERLVRQDGDLEQVLRRQIGRDDSELHKTLLAHIGADSPLMKMLSPDQSQGLLAALRNVLDEQLTTQREHVLSQFSLDNKEGALSRFINELAERHGQLSDELHGKLDEVVRQFSLDDDDSALSRLVRNVDQAQRTITSEFSLDDESSALARLKRELWKLMEDQREANQKFQEEVKTALEVMVARKQEAAQSTLHGLDFEAAVYEMVQRDSRSSGDVATHTGQTVGRIKNCKKGDCVVELGPESAAPGARFVVEAKEVKDYSLSHARDEIIQARKNRGACVGLFVYSHETAPQGLEPLTRLGADVFVTWDPQEAASDVYLKAGLSLARAMCVRDYMDGQSQTADIAGLEKAILEIERGSTALDKIQKWTDTIKNNSEHILNSVAATRKLLATQIDVLNEKTRVLKQSLGR